MFKNIKQKLKNKKGFTLVELIVVIVIILILAAVLVPNVLRYVEQSRQANVKQDAASVLTQVQADVASAASGETTVVTGLSLSQGLVTIDTTSYTPAGVSVNGTASVSALATDKKNCVIEIGTTGETVNVVTYFSYTNGNYSIKWVNGTGWGTPTVGTTPS